MNYNFYIVNSNLSTLSSLKRILRRELFKSEVEGSIIVRSTSNFISSLNTLSKLDVFIIDIKIFSQDDLSKIISRLSTESTLIVLLENDFDIEKVSDLIDRGITKFIKIKDFSIELIKEYISNDIEAFEADYYLKKTNLDLSNDKEIDSLEISNKDEIKTELIIESEEKQNKERQNPLIRKAYRNIVLEKINSYKTKKSEVNRAITTAGRRYLNIWGDYQFGCEFAYILSKEMPLKILLLDSNRLAPSIDMYFGIEKFSKSYQINDDNSYNTGLNIAIDAIRKNLLTKELIYDISKQHKRQKNLYFLSGSYNINNYEYYDLKSYMELISVCKDSFDVVITLSNENIYDLYTSISIIKSDINLIPMQAHYDNIRKINNQISFMVDKQNVSLKKNYIVPFEYMKGVDVSLDYLKDISVCKSVSRVSFSKERRSKRSQNKCYVEKLDKKQEAEYQKIIGELGYL